MRQQPKREQHGKNNGKNSKRLVCRGELVILLPVPATVQWTIWLQQVAGRPNDESLEQKQKDGFPQKKRENEKQRHAQRTRFSRRGEQRNRSDAIEPSHEEESLDEEYLDEMNRRLQEQLQELLLALSPPAFERLLVQLLEQIGYTDLHRLNNDQHNLPPRHSSQGRHTLRGLAQLRAHLGKREDALSVLVTAKRYPYPLSRRFVDELRGAMLRHQAQLGLLVTTGTFPPAARRAVQEDAHLPVLLMDGAQLRLRRSEHRLGVERLANGRLAVDPFFFAQFEAQAMQLT